MEALCSGRWSVNRPNYTLCLKHQRLNRLVEEAQLAHERHDSFKLYQIINKHCPRIRSKRIHLKGDDGKFLTPMEETAAYVHHIATNWAGPET